jgi:membrane protein
MAISVFNARRLKWIGLRMLVRAKRITLPFFDGIPLYDVMLFFWRSIAKGAITTRASGIAFNFFLALFPFLIFLFTLIPYIKIPNFQNEMLAIIEQLVPDSTFETIDATITDIFKNPRGELLSLGFLMALFFATNGLTAMISAFDATVHSYKSRSWLGQRLISILLLMILSTLLTAAIALLTGSRLLVNILTQKNIIQEGLTVTLLMVGKWIVIIALFFFAYSFLYYLAPAKKFQWRFISAGGTLATLLSILTVGAFGYYINHFSQYNKLYGSIGALLIILLLLYFISLILLIGFELNASILEAHKKRTIHEKPGVEG